MSNNLPLRPRRLAHCAVTSPACKSYAACTHTAVHWRRSLRGQAPSSSCAPAAPLQPRKPAAASEAAAVHSAHTHGRAQLPRGVPTQRDRVLLPVCGCVDARDGPDGRGARRLFERAAGGRAVWAAARSLVAAAHLRVLPGAVRRIRLLICAELSAGCWPACACACAARFCLAMGLSARAAAPRASATETLFI